MAWVPQDHARSPSDWIERGIGSYLYLGRQGGVGAGRCECCAGRRGGWPPRWDGVSSGRSGVEGVRDRPVVVADVDRDEVVGEVEDAEHGNIKGSHAVS